jgi:hypothetical protein
VVIEPHTVLVGLGDLQVRQDSGSQNRLKCGLKYGPFEKHYFKHKIDNFPSFCGLDVGDRYLIYF